MPIKEQSLAQKGAYARAASLTPERRTEIARAAGNENALRSRMRKAICARFDAPFFLTLSGKWDGHYAWEEKVSGRKFSVNAETMEVTEIE